MSFAVHVVLQSRLWGKSSAHCPRVGHKMGKTTSQILVPLPNSLTDLLNFSWNPLISLEYIAFNPQQLSSYSWTPLFRSPTGHKKKFEIAGFRNDRVTVAPSDGQTTGNQLDIAIAILLVSQHAFCYNCNFANHETKELFVLTVNRSLVGTLITMGDETRSIATARFDCSYINSFTPESDQCQISPPAPPEILHSFFIAYSDERWLQHKFSLPHLCIFSLKGWENVILELRSERVNSFNRILL